MSKIWFITGSSRGLGRSLAEAVLAHGDLLVASAFLICLKDHAHSISLNRSAPILVTIPQHEEHTHCRAGKYHKQDSSINHPGATLHHCWAS